MSLYMIFTEATEHQPRLLVLKLFMLLWKPVQKIINKNYIITKCIELMCSFSTETTMGKAYCDFLVQFDSHPSIKEAIISHKNIKVRIYGTIHLYIQNR